ncbi:N-acetylglucosamine kinase [Actinopolyspora mortivallis]|uniref:ATPase n=1 Tax=Actinopolyspora mortivallis TaxID=33906 RepID=A0A2T0GWW0_ACTMO|nr:BadF/BadG/BcrA/BcrD ATPase family protein [Actinopolyspora mortivallis]PRW63584.1 ATPase [Actinopolyspora mortivallis]
MTDTTDDKTLVLGLDVGGTSSRAVVADLDSRVLGVGHAGGGNPNSHPPEYAVEQTTRAARSALSGVDRGRVGAAVLGMAGISKLSDPGIAGRYEQAWRSLGLGCEVRTVSDSEVAFAAGTPEPSGTALIAGTGSIVARIENHVLSRTVGGHGWLLGDEGSAFWLGREAVRVTLRALERGTGKNDPLVASVLNEVLADQPRNESDTLLCRRLISFVGDRPVKLAELAPLVTASASEGGGKARGIVSRAAHMLATDVLSVHAEEDERPVVLAGGLLCAEGPLGQAVRGELAERSRAQPITAGSGAIGAAWLAARQLVDEGEALRLHERWFGERTDSVLHRQV